MSVEIVKTIIGALFLAAACLASALMLNLMGRPEHKTAPEKLRRAHKAAGIVFIALLLANAVLGVRLIAGVGDAAPVRVWFKVVFSLTLLLVLTLKIFLVRFYKGFLKTVPPLGLTVLVLAFLIFLLSGGFSLVRGFDEDEDMVVAGDPAGGASLFTSSCASCHAADRETPGPAGPGLKGLLHKPNLPVSGRPATAENVRRQLQNPWRAMPSFARLETKQVADLLAYLESL